MNTNNWPYNIDPKRKQRIPTTDGTLLGTCYYIAPEAILAAGWTVEELQTASNMSIDDLICEDTND